MSKKALTLLLLCAILALPTFAQGRRNVRINEVMVQQDSTGGNGWVEFYNSSYSSTAVEQMFITTLSREDIQNVFDKNKGNKKKPKQILVELCEAQPRFPVVMSVIPRLLLAATSSWRLTATPRQARSTCLSPSKRVRTITLHCMT